MPSDLGSLAALAGQAMLLVAVLLTVGGLLLTLPRLLRVRRRALALSAQLEALRVEVLEARGRLEQRREETVELLRPVRRLRKWLRHPLSVAALQSVRRGRRHRRA